MSQSDQIESQESAPHAGARCLLIVGGARSGKSTFAERLAAGSGRRVAFIATATTGDDEMRERIEAHRASRPADWQTIEEPLHIARAVCRAASVADVLLLDCLTVWLSNWLFMQGDVVGSAGGEETTNYQPYLESALAEIAALLDVLRKLDASKTLLVVSNEVGLGIVPAYPLGRVYRDLLGHVNQRVAASAERVYLMIAGLAVDIKRLHEQATL